MSSTFGILEASRSGLNAAQIGMSITSHNEANADTKGYTRQAIDATSISSDTGSYRYSDSSANVGRGVKVNGVYQLRDSFLDIRYRYENSNYSLYNAMESQMTPIEDQFNEVTSGSASTNKNYGFTGAVTNLLTTLGEYTNSSTTTDVSADVEAKADIIATTIRQDASYLNSTLTSEKNELSTYVCGGNGDTSNGKNAGGVNGMIEDIQTLNQEISGYELTGKTANDLRDARNRDLDTLSSYMDIDTTEQANGMVTIKLKNDSDDDIKNGKSRYIIDSGNNANEFKIADNTVNYSTTDTSTNPPTITTAKPSYTVIEWGDHLTADGTRTDAKAEEAKADVTGNGYTYETDPSDSTKMVFSKDTPTISGTKTTNTTQSISARNIANVQGGIAKAYLNVINGDGSSVDDATTGKCGNLGITYLKGKLNQFAVSFLNIMNNAATDNSKDFTVVSGSKTGTSTTDAVTGKTTVGKPTQFITYNGSTFDADLTAKTVGDSTYYVVKAVDTSTDVADTISVTSDWNKTPDNFINNYNGASKTDYYNAYKTALDVTTNTVTTVATDGAKSTYNRTFCNFATSFSTELSNSVGKVTSTASYAKTTRSNLSDQRDSITTVSSNDEAVNLIKYQQAYNANSRVITAIDQMLDKLINGTGTVGT